MIIDSLTHATPDGRWFSTPHDAGIDRLRRELDAARVDRAVVVALAGFISNDFVLDLCGRDGRLIPGCSFDPTAYGNPAAELRAQLGGTPFRVLKLHPRLNRYDPLDPRCLATLEELASWPQPFAVWIDSLLSVRGISPRHAPAETACELADRFPSLDLLFLHAGGSLALRFAEALRDRPNASIDLSFTAMHYACSSLDADIRWIVSNFDRRTTFGSDFPEYGVASAFDTFRRTIADLPAEKVANVLGMTAARLLRIA